jgi:hypothetical protein
MDQIFILNKHLFSVDDRIWTIGIIIYAVENHPITLNPCNESLNIICIYITVIYIVSVGLPLEIWQWSGYIGLLIARFLATSTRQCNFRHNTSQVINSTSNFKPVYCVNMQTRNTDECIKWFISCMLALLPCPFRNQCNIRSHHAFGTGTRQRHELPAQLRLSIRSRQHINCSVNIISKGSTRTNQCCWHRQVKILFAR